MIAASAPAIVAPQTRNAALDARTPAIPSFPAARALQRLSCLGEFACGRDGDQLDPCGREDLLGVGGMHAPIPGHQARCPTKHLLMMAYCFHRLLMLVGLLQDLVACHDAALHLIEDHVPPKLDLGASLVAGEVPRVWLPHALNFFFPRDLLSSQNAPGGLGDAPL